MRLLRFSFIAFATFLFIPLLVVQAQEVFPGGDEDYYYDDSVIFPGAELPSNLDSTQGTSSVEVQGNGTVTVGDRLTGGDLRVTVLGGTTVKSTRYWNESDIKTWWNGTFPSPKKGRAPSTDQIVFSNPGNHLNSEPHVSVTFEMGGKNESWSFSQEALFVFPVTDGDGVRLWLAQKENELSDNAKWNISESNSCIVNDGVCVVTLSTINSVALVREFYTDCPPNLHGVIENGFVSGPPTCSIQCDRGYELNEVGTGCVEAVFEGGGVLGLGLDDTESKIFNVRPGYFRLTKARGQIDRFIDSDGLSGDDKIRIDRQNAALLGTLAEEKAKFASDAVVSDPGEEDDAFLNYLLERNASGGKNPNVFSESAMIEGDAEQGGVVDEGEDGMSKGGFHASAPLLPSTGPEVFVVLVVVGFALMLLSRRGRSD